MRPGGLDPGEHLRGRGPAELGGPHDGHPAGLQEVGDPGAVGHDHQRAPLGLPAGVHHGGQVGDPDPVGRADRQRGLDRGTGVIDVHVDVPQRVPAHDHQRVAEPGQPRLEPRDGLVGGVEQVHDLVGRPAVAVEHVLGIGQGVGLRGEAGELREHAVDAGDDLEEGVGEHHVAAPARIDHARPAQGLELGGGPGQCGAGGLGRRLRDGLQVAVGLRGDLRGRRCRRPCDREDRALLGVGHRTERRRGRPGQRVGQPRAVHGPGQVGGSGRGDPAQELGHDHPGVPAGTEEHPAGQRRQAGVAGLRDVALDGHHRRDPGLEREVHVGPGVAVGDGEHVEGIDGATVCLHPVEGQRCPARQRLSVENRAHGPPVDSAQG